MPGDNESAATDLRHSASTVAAAVAAVVVVAGAAPRSPRGSELQFWRLGRCQLV